MSAAGWILIVLGGTSALIVVMLMAAAVSARMNFYTKLARAGWDEDSCGQLFVRNGEQQSTSQIGSAIDTFGVLSARSETLDGFLFFEFVINAAYWFEIQQRRRRRFDVYSKDQIHAIEEAVSMMADPHALNSRLRVIVAQKT